MNSPRVEIAPASASASSTLRQSGGPSELHDRALASDRHAYRQSDGAPIRDRYIAHPRAEPVHEASCLASNSAHATDRLPEEHDRLILFQRLHQHGPDGFRHRARADVSSGFGHRQAGAKGKVRGERYGREDLYGTRL